MHGHQDGPEGMVAAGGAQIAEEERLVFLGHGLD